MSNTKEAVQKIVTTAVDGMSRYPERATISVFEGAGIITVSIECDAADVGVIQGRNRGTEIALQSMLREIAPKPVSLTLTAQGRRPEPGDETEVHDPDWDETKVVAFFDAIANAYGKGAMAMQVIRDGTAAFRFAEVEKPIPELPGEVFHGAIRIARAIAKRQGGDIRVSWVANLNVETDIRRAAK